MVLLLPLFLVLDNAFLTLIESPYFEVINVFLSTSISVCFGFSSRATLANNFPDLSISSLICFLSSKILLSFSSLSSLSISSGVLTVVGNLAPFLVLPGILFLEVNLTHEPAPMASERKSMLFSGFLLGNIASGLFGSKNAFGFVQPIKINYVISFFAILKY